MFNLLFYSMGAFLIFRIVERIVRSFQIKDKMSKTVLITGCDSGFGFNLAKRLNAQGVKVIAACLTEKGCSKLKEECGSSIQTELLDITDEKSIDDLKSKLEIQLENGLYGLVNNAGIMGSFAGRFEWHNLDDFRKVLEVNSYGCINMSLKFFSLLKKGNGRIVNMASSAGRIHFATNMEYGISKHCVESFSDCLRIYLKTEKIPISVHIIEPGFCNTSLLNRDTFLSLVEKSLKRLPEEEQVKLETKEIMDEEIRKHTKYSTTASTEIHEVIDAYEYALFSKFPRKRYSVGKDSRLVFIPVSYLPSCIADKIVIYLENRK